MELYDLACGLSSYGARSLSLVVPFFGYSTMERAVHPGEVVTAKNRARLLSSIPAASNGNRIFLVDLHVDGITHYFEGSMQPVHVYAKKVIKQAARELGGDDFVLGCTDAGRAKWVESLAQDMGVEAAFVYKTREGDGDVKVSGVSAHVSGKAVVIYDDMIRSGASLLNAAQAYRSAGATAVWALTTHAVFPGEAVTRIKASGLIDKLVVTNTHPRALEVASSYVDVRTIEPILAEALGASV
jgi:ribose-phosphate pyrophosphokinase